MNPETYVNCSTSTNIVRFERLFIIQLFAAVNEPDLINLNSFLLLELLLHVSDRVAFLKIERLLATSQRLDSNLHLAVVCLSMGI